jgi:predicted dienelactone hydrolase
MQQPGSRLQPQGGLGIQGPGSASVLRSFTVRARQPMSIVDDIRVRVFCQSARPERTGPHAVGTTRLKLQPADAGRDRHPIVVQLWYPVEGGQAPLHARGLNWLAKLLHPTWAPVKHGAPLTLAKTTFPFIAYVPDLPGHHDDNTFTLANLASHGFIIAAIDDPYRNGRVEIGLASAGTPLTSGAEADQIEARLAERVARGVATASALLDALAALKADGPGGVWADRLDLKQVGIMGYAMGGRVAAETALADRRYSVVASLDGAPSRKGAALRTPYMLMLSDFSMPAPRAPVSKAAAPQSRLDEYRRAQDQAGMPESHVIEVAGTRQEHFSDRLIFPTRLFAGFRQLPSCRRIRAIIDTYTVAFFTTYLQADPHPLMCVRHSPYPEVRFVNGSEAHDAWALREPAGRG